jgi:hypothetical protein
VPACCWQVGKITHVTFILSEFVNRFPYFKLFWFLLMSLSIYAVIVKSKHFSVGLRVGKNQMCLNVRWLFLHGTQRFAATRSWRFSPQNLMRRINV